MVAPNNPDAPNTQIINGSTEIIYMSRAEDFASVAVGASGPQNVVVDLT